MDDGATGLVAALKDRDWKVRLDAVQALRVLRSAEALPPLIAALKDGVWHVREGAANALGALGNPDAVPGLIEALKDPDRDVRRGVLEALGAIGSAEAIHALIAALSNLYTQHQAALVLGEIAASNPTPLLRAALPALRSTRNRTLFGVAARSTYDDVRQQIEKATADLPDLPVTAAASASSGENLPLTAAAPTAVASVESCPTAPAIGDAAGGPCEPCASDGPSSADWRQRVRSFVRRRQGKA